MKCESCGMPMNKKEEFGGHNLNNKYCLHCTDEKGNLKDRDEVRNGMVDFFMKSQNKNNEEATKFVDAYMKQMPAWK